MRFYFNLPSRVTKVKIVLTEKKDDELVQEKSYDFTREQLRAFFNDRQRAAYINTLISRNWANPEDVRKAKKEMRAKREAKKEKRHPWGNGDKNVTEIEKVDEEQAEFAKEEGGNE